MKIVWDPPKRQRNLTKHCFDFEELDSLFFEMAMILEARTGRFKAVGNWNGSMIAVIFRPLGAEAVSVISMRPASAAERKIWKRNEP